MIYTQVLHRGSQGIWSPLDRLPGPDARSDSGIVWATTETIPAGRVEQRGRNMKDKKEFRLVVATSPRALFGTTAQLKLVLFAHTYQRFGSQEWTTSCFVPMTRLDPIRSCDSLARELSALSGWQNDVPHWLQPRSRSSFPSLRIPTSMRLSARPAYGCRRPGTPTSCP